CAFEVFLIHMELSASMAIT
ncbi:hypothetical protein KPH14_007915, partial [Odynerus spinipes]